MKQAIIDIGSNSIRLTLYETEIYSLHEQLLLEVLEVM